MKEGKNKDNKSSNKDRADNKTVSKRLLESYRAALYKVEEFFNSIQSREFDEDNIEESMKIVQSILNAGDKLGKNIETLVVLEKKVEQEETEKIKVTGNKKISLLESGDLDE